jgi:hypothetical protein
LPDPEVGCTHIENDEETPDLLGAAEHDSWKIICLIYPYTNKFPTILPMRIFSAKKNGLPANPYPKTCELGAVDKSSLTTNP